MFVKCLNNIFLSVPQFLSSGVPKTVAGCQHRSKKDDLIEPREAKSPPKGVQNHPRGCPRRFRKKESAKKRCTGLKFQAIGSKMGSRNRKVGDIFIDIFQYFPASFLRGISNGILDDVWIGFRCFSCFIWMSLGIFLKPVDLAKSVPRPHGSMVF